jgi:two-component system, NtrC family, response regulator AtoC
VSNLYMTTQCKEDETLNQGNAYAEDGFITSSPRMFRIIDIAKQVAQTDVPVLILGESGVGKDVLASFIHRRSDRSHRPFVKVNCAALPAELLESELFGYDQGAFTGAARSKPGKFELADNGTLLLDEIGEMSPQLQAKLLHVLQDGEFSRLGARSPTKVNVRVLAATNRNLRAAVLKGEFRNDLYFRLNVIKVEIPPLRERRGDILLLCKYFLEKYRERYASSVQTLPQGLLEACVWYNWPGNIRELENFVKRQLILADSEINSELCSEDCEALSQSAPPSSLLEIGDRAAEQAERTAALDMLEETGWNRKESARRLHVSYKTFRNRLRKWELSTKRPSGCRISSDKNPRVLSF